MVRSQASKRCLAGYMMLFCWLCSPATHADTAADLRLLGRKATAMVYHSYRIERDDGPHQVASRGTALCLTRSGYFLTDAHVLGPSTEVRLAIERPGQGVWFYDASLVDLNKDLDLAVLKVNNAEAFVPVEIAAPTTVRRGQHITAFGFPASAEEADVDEAHLTVSVKSLNGHITALHGTDPAHSDLMADTPLGPGSSGGPVLNDRGQLVGIIQRGNRSANITLARSASAILRFLASPRIAAVINPPELRFSPPAGIAAADMTREHPFEAQVLAGLTSLRSAQATLTFAAFGATPRSFPATIRPDGACRLHVAPLPPHSEPHTVTLTLSGRNRSRIESCQALDRSLLIGARSVPLSAVSRLDLNGDAVVTLCSGERIPGQPQGLEAIQICGKDLPVIRDLRGEGRIAVRDDKELPRAISYRLAVIQADKTIVECSGRIRVEGLAPRRLGQPLVLACGTAWATNSAGSQKGHAADLSPSTVRYIQNIAALFSGGARANLLIQSDHWTFGTPFQEVLRAMGHTVTATLDPGPLDQYDAIFVGGHEVDQQALLAYVQQGGKVYVSGGADANGGIWNAFLDHFGLSSQADSKPDLAPGSDFHYAPLFEGVSSLTLRQPYQIVRTAADLPEAQTICFQSQTNLWGIYRGGEKLGPTPAQIAATAARAEAAAQKIREHQYAIDHRTIDAVRIGDANSERKHALKGDHLVSGQYDGKSWRAANTRSGFSYTLQLEPQSANHLVCTFAWIDGQPGDCDIFVDDMPLGYIDLSLPRVRPGYMSSALYELPPRMTAGKSAIVVRFQTRRSDKTPELFQCELQRGVPGFDAKPRPTREEDLIPPQGFPVVDTVKIGDPDSERAHGLQGDRTQTAAYRNAQWRAAFDGGWFSYTLKVHPQERMALSLQYFGGDAGGRDFDIRVEGMKLVTVSLQKRYSGQFYGAVYPIPERWTRNKAQIEVRFVAHQGNIAGGIYGCQITQR